MDFLVSTGTSAAYVFALIGFIRAIITGMPRDMDVSYAETSAVLITVVVLGKYLETSARNSTSAAIHSLTNRKPTKARLVKPAGAGVVMMGTENMNVVREGTGNDSESGPDNSGTILSPMLQGSEERERGRERGDDIVDASMLHYGDIVRLVEGETAPADGILINTSFSSSPPLSPLLSPSLSSPLLSMDESLITGESVSIEKKERDTIIGGSVVLSGTSLMLVTTCGDGSVLGCMLSSIHTAQMSKPPIQEYADRVATYFVPVVTSLSLLTFFIWLFLSSYHLAPSTLLDKFDNDSFFLSFSFALAVWVSACPCAIGLATPTAVMVSTGVAAKNGILIKRGSAIQNMVNATVIAFDKTGTLTRGKPTVCDFILYENIEDEQEELENKEEKEREKFDRNVIVKTFGIEITKSGENKEKNINIILERKREIQMKQDDENKREKDGEKKREREKKQESKW
eukprot:CAMPEP_0182439536 /NCGR_PEP_ID=MMETSP1167-20130531/86500_1 /TAXON_ID=2988 /ORGANISM="Mallomonas Sp, Strain CCMP3275" /LENGTH=457 /DNA_ID=CAMNT_0024633269 /DNA_START=1087 /DNA_END=2457 /DNA_ORIENTATION=+